MANITKLSGVGKAIENQIRQNAEEIGNALSSMGKNLFNSRFNRIPLTALEDSEDLIFPLNLKEETDNLNFIKFTSYEKGGKQDASGRIKSIWFPSPGNISFNDSATFNTINLGLLGGIGSRALKDSNSTATGFAEAVVNQLKAAQAQFRGAEIASAGIQQLPDAGLLNDVSTFATKTIVNPNTNTTFTGNPIRNFTFAFKMVAESQNEAELIKRIHSRFRAYTYADSRSNDQNLILSFPPLWTIRFLDGNGNDNHFIPKIFSCYLTGVESSFNSTANIYHVDDAPLEVDIALSFQETRALSRTDIDKLENGSIGVNRGIDLESSFSTTDTAGSSGIADPNQIPE